MKLLALPRDGEVTVASWMWKISGRTKGCWF
jgi:hypothetical protein